MYVLGIIYESKPNIVADIQMAFMKRQQEVPSWGYGGEICWKGMNKEHISLSDVVVIFPTVQVVILICNLQRTSHIPKGTHKADPLALLPPSLATQP